MLDALIMDLLDWINANYNRPAANLSLNVRSQRDRTHDRTSIFGPNVTVHDIRLGVRVRARVRIRTVHG